MGFSVNTVPISDEIGQLRNVIDQYRPGLVAGSSDPAVALPEFLAKLEAAGIGTVIAEVQLKLTHLLPIADHQQKNTFY